MPERIPWNRWICPRDKAIRFDDRGYPEEPGGRYAAAVQPDCVTLDSVLAARCGVLLGEAGIGKSDAIDQLEATLKGAGRGAVIRVNLGEYSDTADLDGDLFASRVFLDWKQGNGDLDLLLDSLDEGLAGVRNIVGLLQRRLRNLPFDRLHIYISCRTTAWPETLTSHLVESFGGEDKVKHYQLVPLLRNDISLGARAAAVDPDAFLSQVDVHNAQALACNPLTLRLLLNVFTSTGFPGSGRELLERGLLALCEPTQSRRDRQTATPYTAAQLLAVASRIAALSLLSGHAVVDTGNDTGGPRGGISTTDLLGGDEPVGDTSVTVDEAVLRAALATGLFSARGAGRFGFAHKTYGEFLAARYLSMMKMPEPQLESLLSLTDRTPPQYVSQLHEVVAWLAAFDDAFFERVMAREPEILLASDLPAEDGATRARTINAILERTQAGAISYDRRRNFAAQLKRLNHGNLGAQLTVALRDRARSDATREIALTIAEQCHAIDVAHVAADIALDSTESLGLRIDAGYAVCRLNVPEANARLKPLAFSSPTDDPQDELRGLALRATWPASMTPSELFSALRPPLHNNFSGSYSAFFRTQKISEQLTDADLPGALTWVAQQQLDDDFWRPLARVSGGIVTRVFSEADTALLHQLAPIVYGAYHDFRCPFFIEPGEEKFGDSNDTISVNRLIEGNAEARHVLISEIVRGMPADTHFHLLAHSACPLVRESDFVWLLERSCSTTGDEAVIWAKLARRVMSWNSIEHVDAWLEMSTRCPVVATVLDYPRVIEIESVEGRRLRAEHLRELRRQQRETQGRITPDVQASRINRVLTETLGERPELFANLVQELNRDLMSGRIERESDLRASGGWKAAASDERIRIVDAAEQYLLRANSPTSNPLDTLRSWSLADEAPSIAALLLLHERPSVLNALPEDVCRRRAPQILTRFIGFFQAPAEEKDAVAEIINASAPNECRATLLAIIDHPDAPNDIHSLVALWENRLDESLAHDVFERVRVAGAEGSSFTTLLGWLLRKNYEAAVHFAEGPLQQSADARCLPCAIVAVRQRPEVFWSQVWRLIEGDQTWGKQFFTEFLAFTDEGAGLLSVLTPEDIGRLLDWILTAYPVDDDSSNAGGQVGPRDHIRFFRNALIERLKQAGSREACVALRGVRDAHPEYPWLSEVLLQAQAVERQSSWSPPSPGVLRQLFADSRTRFITNTTQLLDVLVESLDRFAQSLHGELPARTTLWNQLPGGTNRPKDEEHLSDAVARHFRTDLVERGTIVNREVQIRRREVAVAAGGQAGQRTDIRVDVVRAAEHGDPAILTAIVEVKGCWHPEVETAMADQLAGRYLHENDCQTGLYLVGWYLCDGWDDSDARKGQVPRTRVEEVENALRRQAAGLTTPEKRPEIRAYVLDCALR